MNRITKNKRPTKKVTPLVGSFGKSKFITKFDIEIKGLPRHIRFATRSETCYYLSEGIGVLSESGSPLSIKLKSKGDISHFSIRPDDKLMAVCIDSNIVEIVDLENRKSISSFQLNEKILALFYSGDGKIHIATDTHYACYD